MLSRIRIRKHELGLWFRHGDFVRLLKPGVYFLPGRAWKRDQVEIFDTLRTRFEHPLLDVLVGDESVRSEVVVVELREDQRALVWKDGRLAFLLGPGRHAFWKRPYELDVEVCSVTEPRLRHRSLSSILANPQSVEYLTAVEAGPSEQVLLFCEGELLDSVVSGLVAFWKRKPPIVWKAVDLREQVLDVSGQEIMTADKVTLRCNLAVTYQVTDAVTAVTGVEDFRQALYREAQLALRAAINGRALDALLSDKLSVSGEILAAIAARVSEFGLTVKSAGLRDVILPGDMKTILNRVIEAEKQAEANLIRRREETAAARSQANTAKLIAENPTLSRMKELEAVQEILRGANATFVLGPTDLVRQVRDLAAPGKSGAGNGDP